MVIDCARCELRGLECGDCLVTVLSHDQGPASASRRALGAQELRALAALAAAGLVPPLRFRPVPSAEAAVIVAL